MEDFDFAPYLKWIFTFGLCFLLVISISMLFAGTAPWNFPEALKITDMIVLFIVGVVSGVVQNIEE